jgi:hypothetical protein
MNSYMPSRLPHLAEATVVASFASRISVPLGLFSNLSKLTVASGMDECSSNFIRELATAITNSPRLKTLDMTYWGSSSSRFSLPSLSDLFVGLSPENPLHLERLRIRFIDATVNQVTLPHLAKLTSFEFYARRRIYCSRADSGLVYWSMVSNCLKCRSGAL